ncbi:MAG TPA: SurA N-terminal domain-containing protein [Candidatus Methylacidiphilales bacterium]|nr:SurA N-terminal domain-containing protein [Candidatus Methylacidiphilales bacterium]
MRFLRNQSQTVLVVILGVLGLSFLFYGNVGSILTSSSSRGPGDYGSIDGNNLTSSDLVDAIHDTRYSLIMQGRKEILNQQGMDAQVAEESWRQLLLKNEAEKLHIDISDQELEDYIKQNPVFQDPATKAYSPDLYKGWLAQLQGALRIPSDSEADPLATTQAVVLDVLRQMLRAKAVQKALFSTIRASAGDASAAYEKIYAPVTVSTITFDPKNFQAAAQVTPDEIATEYKNNPQNPAYRTEEKRKVDYVLFPLTPDQMKLPEQDKDAALDALGQKALGFARDVQPDPSLSPADATPPDFMAEAKKHGLTAATTDFFTVDQTPAGLPPSPAFNNAAFGLSKDDSVSKVIALSNGVAVLHLAEIQPSVLRPLDEVRAAIQEQLQRTKEINAANTAAKNAGLALQTALTKGTQPKVNTVGPNATAAEKSFVQALQANLNQTTSNVPLDFQAAAATLNLKTETLPLFVPGKVGNNDPKLGRIADVVAGLQIGQISGPTSMETDDTILLIHLDSRGKADPAGLADFETRYHQERDDELRNQVYDDWAEWMSKKPGTHKPPNLDLYGSFE